MELLPDLLMKPEPWSGLMLGNHALVRAMLEAGVKVATTYPGSPTPEIAEAIDSIPTKKRPFYFEYSTNEKVAVEVAFGAAMNGHLSTVFFKSVGLNVASDSAVQLPLMEIPGGMIVVLGDDPGINSSQNEQDNRHFARMAYYPVFEPASPQDTYDMYLQAAELAKRHHMPVIFRMTTHVCHARELVQFGKLPESDYDWTPRFDVANGGPFVPITSAVVPMKQRALKKFSAVAEEAETIACNGIESPNGSATVGGKRLGIIVSSMPILALRENLEESGLPVDVLRLGLSFPLPQNTLRNFLNDHDEVLIIEELDRIHELEIKSFAYDIGSSCKILAKADTYLGGELGPEQTWEILRQNWPEHFKAHSKIVPAEKAIPRTPTFCPGCGHRAAFYAVSQVLEKDTITVADIGCHTMGAFEPYNIGQILLSMGHSNGTAAGMSIGNDSRKIISFIGDSTFFHAGLPAIVNAIVYDHDFTLVVMENGTTAMTGQQPHPGSGELSEAIDIESVLKTLGAKFVRKTGAYGHEKLVQALKEAMDHKGFSVVIASHPCMLKFTRELKKKKKSNPLIMTVDKSAPKQDHEQAVVFDCPSFVRGKDGTISIHKDLCIGDGSCRPAGPKGLLNLVKRQEVAK